MNFYFHFVGDYLRDTKDLSLIEHGAYRLLLDHYYAQRGDMPADLPKLYRACNAMTSLERKAVKEIAERFFPVNGDGRRHNKRADEEIAKAVDREEDQEGRRANERERQRRHRERRKELFEKLRELGKVPSFDSTTEELERMLSALSQRDGQRDGKRDDHADVTRDNTATTTITTTTNPQGQKLSPADAGEVRDGVASVPDCPHERLIEAYHELLPTCTQVVEWNDTRRGLMRARWREKAQAKGKHPGYRTVEEGLDFWRRFFGYVAQSDFLTGRANPAPGRKVFVASLEWLVKPTNFAKVIEGSYHS